MRDLGLRRGPPRASCTPPVSALAELEINILDLSSRVVGDPPVYVLGIEAELPPGVSTAPVEAALQPGRPGSTSSCTCNAKSDEVL